MSPTKPKNVLVRKHSSQRSSSKTNFLDSPSSTSPSNGNPPLLSPPFSSPNLNDSLLSNSSRPRASEDDAAFGNFGAGRSNSADGFGSGGSSEESASGVLMSPQMEGGGTMGGLKRISASYSDSIQSTNIPRGQHSPRFEGRDSRSSGFRAASMVLGPYMETSGEKSYILSPYAPPGGSNRGSIATMPTSTSLAHSFTEDKEDDDYMYLDDPRDRKGSHGRGVIFTWRGLTNLGCISLLLLALLMLFNLGGVNGSGQVPEVVGNFGLIDQDTPDEAKTRWGLEDPKEIYDLVFSDEFETEGRSFYPGDDPYWEAVDLHYWQTGNLEWYSPQQITTEGGALLITLDKHENHNLNYSGGMLTSWNKFCFTEGYIEASVMLPGRPDVLGLWPAIWTMGNLGRAGYGGSLEGLWPYSYQACDVGTVFNQSKSGVPGLQATTYGTTQSLSYLFGQRLSACTCPNIDPKEHPGPQNADGTWVGRSSPEIDIFEAQSDWTTLLGEYSQSAQWAPFDADYIHKNGTNSVKVYNAALTTGNTYLGGPYQQSVSEVTTIDQTNYEAAGKTYGISGFEYKRGLDGYITWVADNKPSWRMDASAVGANPTSQISARPISMEPMYIILNLGISESFGPVDTGKLDSLWPVHMRVEYIRVYQPRGKTNVGCSPPDYPTKDYIDNHPSLYGNPLWTGFAQAGGTLPANSYLDQC